VSHHVRLLECGNQAITPLTCGIFRPLIILPRFARDWSENRRRVVICHELAHIARADWLLQIGAELACGLYWFHPLAWVAAGHMRQESERACDDFVLNYGIEAPAYANELLDLARTLKNTNSTWSTALALTRPSNLERRLLSMLNPSISHSLLSVRSRLATLFLSLALLIPVAALHLPAQDLSGKFSGTVYDPSGAPIPNATVIIFNHSTNKADMTTSGSEGKFNFTGLPAGNYQLKVVKQGFAEYNASQIVLQPNRESAQSITLKVSFVTEEVDVVAEGTGRAVKTPRVRLGGDIQAAKLLKKVQPIYPAAAKAAGIEGEVILYAIIGMKGTPLSLRVMNSEVDPELARSAVEAVSKWRYSPTLLNGEPIEVDTTIMVSFKLLP
jgi:TonB family protein